MHTSALTWLSENCSSASTQISACMPTVNDILKKKNFSADDSILEHAGHTDMTRMKQRSPSPDSNHQDAQDDMEHEISLCHSES